MSVSRSPTPNGETVRSGRPEHNDGMYWIKIPICTPEKSQSLQYTAYASSRTLIAKIAHFQP